VPEITSLAAPVGNETMVEDRVEPTAQIPIRSALVPAGECPFEDVLYEIIGPLTVTAQQSVRVAAQSWDVRFEKFGRVSACTLHGRKGALHRTTSNTEPASGISKCSQATKDQQSREVRIPLIALK
jgi:hypothetical protein